MAPSKRINRVFSICMLIGGMIFMPVKSRAQIENNSIHDTINQDDLGNVSDKFQDCFFDALTQRAIENYEKAIKALKKCQGLNSEKAVIYFELGENYSALKDYPEAEENFLKALKKQPDDRAILTSLYDVYYQTKNYPKAINTAKKLTAFDINYYEDLANLYLLSADYVLGLKALDRINSKKGQSDYRDALRRRILAKAKGQKGVIAYLKDKIEAAPENTQNYTDLMFAHDQAGQMEKAFQTAEKLQKIHPKAPQPHLVFYKIYRKKGQHNKAVESMKAVLTSETIGNDVKKEVIQDFSDFVKKNPQYENDLVQVLGEEESEGNQSNQQLGEYYIGKNNKKAISFFKKALDETPNNFKLIKETLLLQVKENQFADALKLAKRALGIFPSQPIFYLLRGVSENALENYKPAEESLNTGVDFVIDNPQMKADFYTQLSKAYQGLGNSEKAAAFQQKAANLKTNETK